MRTSILLLLTLSLSLSVSAQRAKVATKKSSTATATSSTDQPKKYPSLLWEITGNGLKKPSYLFGTMHVSNKMVFNLGDSFYNAIKSVDVVALEQDPNLWQEEYTKRSGYNEYNIFGNYGDYGGGNHPDDKLSISTFNFGNYEEKLKASLAMEAQLVNGMMYRVDPGIEDFQEETYLDMYIYRAGKKFNKIIVGVENGKESNRLVKKAYIAMNKDRNKQRKSYDYNDGYASSKKLEEAYRTGNLDLLDSIEMANVRSENFQEYFMYKRNVIQANSIDTIVKKNALFVGVGAAHLPGTKGVIELLRKMGYKLRPIMMGERNSDEKEKLEKIKVPLNFKQQWMEDSAFTVQVPGDKLFRYPSMGGLNMVQYADMPNGSYYMVTRVKTNAAILGNDKQAVIKKIDSLLYENIPGKITEKKTIKVQGYDAYSITNKTRRGDVQRYNIIVLPNEVVILKVAGVADYVLEENAVNKFLSSINFRNAVTPKPVVYEPPFKGFSVNLPQEPDYLGESRNQRDRHEWSTVDANGNSYLILKTNLHQYDFLEVDTFDLGLVEESFTSSKFITKKNTRNFSKWLGYPSLDATYTHKDGSNITAKYLLRKNDYYVLATKHKSKTDTSSFFPSFKFTDYDYGPAKEQKDTSMGYTVKSPIFYKNSKNAEDVEEMKDMLEFYKSIKDEDDDDDDYDMSDYSSYFENYKTATVGNDTTGEHIYIYQSRTAKYDYYKDSTKYMKYRFRGAVHDSDYVVYRNNEWINDKQWRVLDFELRDTGSSRTMIGKAFYKKGFMFQLIHSTDTLSGMSPFAKTFYETFEPADTFKFRDPFEKQSAKFFDDYFSGDSARMKKAKKDMEADIFDSSDLPQVKRAIAALNWDTKKYLDMKRQWVSILGNFHDSATTVYLNGLYIAAKDTSDLQNDVLDALLDQRTAYSFETFKNLVLKDPPALLESNRSSGDSYSYDRVRVGRRSYDDSYSRYSGEKWGPLYDTLQLSSKIIPELLDLTVIDDYKPTIMDLLVTAVDSGYLKADQYKSAYNRIFLESKQMLKKQFAEEEKLAIEKASIKKDKKKKNKKEEDEDEDEEKNDSYGYNRSSGGNQELLNQAVLLMPYWSEHPEVQDFFKKLITTSDKELRFGSALLMLRNKKEVADSIILAIAEKDNYRLKLYNELKDAKLLDKFPAKFKNQESIIRAMFNAESYGKPDSLVYLEKQLVTTNKGKKGWVYFYKYKAMKDDAKWMIAFCGLQPENLNEIESTASVRTYSYSYDSEGGSSSFMGLTKEHYEPKKDLKPVFDKIIKEKLYQLRPSTSSFYDTNDSDVYESYLPDAVKARRRY